MKSKVELESYSMAQISILKILRLKCQWYTLERRLKVEIYNHKSGLKPVACKVKK